VVRSSRSYIEVSQRADVFGHGNDANRFLIELDRFIKTPLRRAHLRETRQCAIIIWISPKRFAKLRFSLEQTAGAEVIASQLPLCPGNGFHGLLGHLSDRNGGSQVLFGTCDVTAHAFHTPSQLERASVFVQA